MSIAITYWHLHFLSFLCLSNIVTLYIITSDVTLCIMDHYNYQLLILIAVAILTTIIVLSYGVSYLYILVKCYSINQPYSASFFFKFYVLPVILCLA